MPYYTTFQQTLYINCWKSCKKYLSWCLKKRCIVSLMKHVMDVKPGNDGQEWNRWAFCGLNIDWRPATAQNQVMIRNIDIKYYFARAHNITQWTQFYWSYKNACLSQIMIYFYGFILCLIVNYELQNSKTKKVSLCK